VNVKEYEFCDRTDLAEEEIWSIYTMLTRIEDAFRSLKSELGLRPVYHQKEDRVDVHIFISILAYHISHAIEETLKKGGLSLEKSNVVTANYKLVKVAE